LRTLNLALVKKTGKKTALLTDSTKGGAHRGVRVLTCPLRNCKHTTVFRKKSATGFLNKAEEREGGKDLRVVKDNANKIPMEFPWPLVKRRRERKGADRVMGG